MPTLKAQFSCINSRPVAYSKRINAHSPQEKAGTSLTRAGAFTLSLLSAPINAVVLDRLEEGPRSLTELRGATAASAATMRRHLRKLSELGVLEGRHENDYPGSVHYELATPGHELAGVAAVVRGWLAIAPGGAIDLGSAAARNAIKALVGGWETGMLRALAARPLSLTELDRLIPDVSYPSLERRLAALRLTRQIKRAPSEGGGTPHAVTDWLRRAVVPITAAVRWEAVRARGTTAHVTNRDIETGFLLSLPLLRLPGELSGSCRLAVEFAHNNGQRHAGILIHLEQGRVVSCVSRLEGSPDSWALGSAGSWMSAVLEHDFSQLEMGGDSALASTLLDRLHGALYLRPPAVAP